MGKLLGIALLISFSISLLAGQDIYGNIKVGALYYQGDLSPMTNRYSSSQARIGISTGLQYYTTDYFSIYTDILLGGLKGDDMYAKELGRLQRNLHFKTPIYELGFGVKYSLNHFVSYLRKIGLNIELVIGANYFYFNPKAKFEGRWIALQPLGTEGQGWAKDQEPKYSKLEWSFSRGVSIKFKINKFTDIGVEFIQRKTYTDYIDDVSTFYINFDEQVTNSTLLAAQLGNRMGEYFDTEPVRVETKTVRGNADKNDSYLFTALTIGYKLFE